MRGKVKRTTISDPRSAKPHELVDRNFRPPAPDRLWVADFTYVSTWSGWCHTAFVIDVYARRILGWAVATTMTGQLVVDAVAQGTWTRQREGKDLRGLVESGGDEMGAWEQRVALAGFLLEPYPIRQDELSKACRPMLLHTAYGELGVC